MSVIEFEHVSKSYRLGASRTSLREALAQTGRNLLRRSKDQADDQLFWALDDVSFQVGQGDVLGIIGHNGAGKSTALKLLSKVTFPTRGQIHTRGRMAALIELGAGFHPDLSGRENIYLNGAILGLKKQEIDSEFSNMVEFAGLEKFIDTPVKRYSSGMYVRLAFAVAAHVKADLLLVDEVLSVGDMAFQQKCLAKMNELRDSGATIVFISHNMWSVSSFCKRVILLQAGQVRAEGTPDEVIQSYRRQEREKLLLSSDGDDLLADAESPSRSSRAEQGSEYAITGIELVNASGQPDQAFDSDDHLIIRAHYVAPTRIENPRYIIRIYRADGLICCELKGPDESDQAQGGIYGSGMFEARIGPLQLVPDIYMVEIHVIDKKQAIVYARSSRETFHIKGSMSGSDHAGVFTPNVVWLPQPATR